MFLLAFALLVPAAATDEMTFDDPDDPACHLARGRFPRTPQQQRRSQNEHALRTRQGVHRDRKLPMLAVKKNVGIKTPHLFPCLKTVSGLNLRGQSGLKEGR